MTEGPAGTESISAGPVKASPPATGCRVLIDGRVISDHFPGIGRYAFHLVEALAEVAPQDRFILLVNPNQVDRRFDLHQLACHPAVELHFVGAPVFGLATQWAVRRAAREVEANLWHATYWLTAYRPGLPTVLSVYDLIGLRQPRAVPPLRRLGLAIGLRLALAAADELLTLSESARADLAAAIRRPVPITVTPLAADRRFRPAAEAEIAALRQRLDLPPRYVLYVGINKPHKNLETLVAAWGRLATEQPQLVAGSERYPPSSLILAGPWDRRYDGPRRMASALSPPAPVRVLGAVPEADLPALYSGAAVFAYPSRYEGFGLPPLEAMACGAPVVAARSTSLPEVVGDAGLLVEPDDLDGWAGALARVLSDARLAEAMRRRSLARAAQFSWHQTAERTLSVYHRLVQRRQG